MSSTFVGTCGFAAAKRACYDPLDAVEIQKTFYRPPRRAPAAGWRAEAPQGFAFPVQVVDPAFRAPVRKTPRSFRLHGPAGYRSQHDDAHLERVASRASTKESHVMFNSAGRMEEAKRLRQRAPRG